MSMILNRRKISRRIFTRQGSLAVAAGFLTPAIMAGKEYPPKEKLAMYQEESAKGTACGICPNECTLKEGEYGDCRSRVVRGSKLYTIAYGNPCTVNVDPVEKKPLYHFLPGSKTFSIATAGCNLACLNCQNWTISQTSPEKTENYDLPPSDVVGNALANNCKSISYTYSEPVTFYEYVYDTSQLARKEGLKNIMVSNGYIKPGPLKELCRFIDGANIDLKSFNDSTYLKLNGGKLQPVLDALKVYRDEGVWLEITNLIIPGWTDKPDEIKLMCEWLVSNGFRDIPLHFIRFHPQYKLVNLPPTPLSILNTAVKAAQEAGLRYIYTGNVPGAATDDTVCPVCRQKVVERTGFSIISNKINKGKCVCGEPIPGRW